MGQRRFSRAYRLEAVRRAWVACRHVSGLDMPDLPAGPYGVRRSDSKHRGVLEGTGGSVQARNAVRTTRVFYRVVFRSERSLAELDEQQQDLLRGLLRVAPKLLGRPFPMWSTW